MPRNRGRDGLYRHAAPDAPRRCDCGGGGGLLDKPLALTMNDAEAVVTACADNGIHLITGPSRSFDQPVETARALIASGKYGAVQMIHAMNYTAFL